MSSKRKQRGIKSERRREKRERQEKIKTATSLLNLNMSLAPRVRTGGYGRVKLPPPYSVPLPSVSLIGEATCLLSEGEVNRLGDFNASV